MKSSIKKGIFIILIVLAWLFFFRKRATTFPMNKADLVMFVVFALYFSGIGLVDSMRYKTPQFVGNPIHASCVMPPVKFGEWAGVRLGGFRMYWYEEGNQGYAVFPYLSFRKHHENISTAVSLIEVDLNKLPPQHVQYVRAHNINPPYYFGIYPDYYPRDYLRYQPYIEELHSTINELRQQLDAKYDFIKTFNDLASNTSQSFNKDKTSIIPFMGGAQK
jgi:hypothetical protein